MKTSILITLFILLALGVNAQKKVKLKGEVKGAPQEYIYFNVFKNKKLVPLDSVRLNKKGKFKMDLKLKDPKEFYSLSFAPDNYALLILDSTHTDKTVTFKAEKKNITNHYTVTGSEESQIIEEFNTLIYNFQKGLDSIKTLYADSISKANAVQNEYYKQFIIKRNAFIERNPESLALLITTQYFNPQTELSWFKKIEKSVGKAAPDSKYHEAIKNQVKQIESALNPRPQQAKEDVNIGKIFVELNFPSPTGEIITMESLRDKYVLVDFWASWCRPCRNENPNVVRLYNKYKDAGFTVYSVSLDTNKDRWLKAIEQDNLSWKNHVSDLKGWRTEATKIYQFRGIPYTMLVDKDGKIIATKLRGKQLEETLKSIFGF